MAGLNLLTKSSTTVIVPQTQNHSFTKVPATCKLLENKDRNEQNLHILDFAACQLGMGCVGCWMVHHNCGKVVKNNTLEEQNTSLKNNSKHFV